MMSSYVFMALYRPKEGKAEELKNVLENHIPTLREEGLITSREPLQLQAADGTIIEIAEWNSKEAMEKAHMTPSVQTIWDEISELAELTNLSSLEEANELFPNFKPL
jgi:quinol monooxygenase YgiN